MTVADFQAKNLETMEERARVLPLTKKRFFCDNIQSRPRMNVLIS